MAEEISKIPERVKGIRPGLLYHGTAGNFELKKELMSEYGLIASIPTLTPSLELALDYASGGVENLLTFWYPKKREVLNRGSESTRPKMPIAESDKGAIIDNIQRSQIPDTSKAMLLDSARSATALLPSSSLGAVALLDFPQSVALRIQLPPHNRNFLQIYSAKQADLSKGMQAILDETKIYFFAQDLDTQRLAVDMVKTDLEHYFLDLGQRINLLKEKSNNADNDREDWQETLLVLQSTHLPEPIYERYRQSLVRKLEAYFQR